MEKTQVQPAEKHGRRSHRKVPGLLLGTQQECFASRSCGTLEKLSKPYTSSLLEPSKTKRSLVTSSTSRGRLLQQCFRTSTDMDDRIMFTPVALICLRLLVVTPLHRPMLLRPTWKASHQHTEGKILSG